MRIAPSGRRSICAAPTTPSKPVAVTITLARRTASSKSAMRQPWCCAWINRTGSRSTTVTLAPRSRARSATTNGAEPDHDDLAAVQRQARYRRERRPGLGADMMPVVNEILERDPVPVQDRKWDIEAGQAVQAGRRGLERTS